MLLQHLLHAVVGVALLRGASATPARVCVSKASTVPFARRGQAPGEADLGGICSECVRGGSVRSVRLRASLRDGAPSQLSLGDVLRPRADGRHKTQAVRADENHRRG